MLNLFPDKLWFIGSPIFNEIVHLIFSHETRPGCPYSSPRLSSLKGPDFRATPRPRGSCTPVPVSGSTCPGTSRTSPKQKNRVPVILVSFTVRD